jgi:hypothetical protein
LWGVCVAREASPERGREREGGVRVFTVSLVADARHERARVHAQGGQLGRQDLHLALLLKRVG